MIRRSLGLFAVLMLIPGCEATAPTPVAIASGATYTSPSGRFTCIVPVMVHPGESISERATPESDTITFADLFGRHVVIQSTTVSDADFSRFTGPDRHRSLIDYCRQQLPAGAQELFVDYPYTSVENAAYIVYRPAGTGAESLAEGVLVFPKNGAIYSVSDRQWPSSTGKVEPIPAEQLAERLLGRLRGVVAEMTFRP